MEMTNCLDQLQEMSYQIVARKTLGKAVKLGGICFNIEKKVISVQSERGNFGENSNEKVQ